MQTVITIAERHGLLIVFLNVLLSQGGLPLPVPTLMTVAALARQSPYQITQIILAGVSGALIAEVALYWCGLHYGQRFLLLLCKLSFSPDFCVRRTGQVFARVGSWSLLFAKFIPGPSLIAVAMAGVTRRWPRDCNSGCETEGDSCAGRHHSGRGFSASSGYRSCPEDLSP